jgi:hypothetical protein
MYTFSRVKCMPSCSFPERIFYSLIHVSFTYADVLEALRPSGPDHGRESNELPGVLRHQEDLNRVEGHREGKGGERGKQTS